MRLKLVLVAALLAITFLAASVPSATAGKQRCTRIGNLKWCYAAKSQTELVGAPPGAALPGDFHGQPTCAKLESIPGLIVFSCEPI